MFALWSHNISRLSCIAMICKNHSLYNVATSLLQSTVAHNVYLSLT